jgi:hypothetical protein
MNGAALEPVIRRFVACPYRRAATKLWFSDVCEQYELEAHHVLLLTIACDAWDNHSAILLS